MEHKVGTVDTSDDRIERHLREASELYSQLQDNLAAVDQATAETDKALEALRKANKERLQTIRNQNAERLKDLRAQVAQRRARFRWLAVVVTILGFGIGAGFIYGGSVSVTTGFWSAFMLAIGTGILSAAAIAFPASLVRSLWSPATNEALLSHIDDVAVRVVELQNKLDEILLERQL